MTEGMGSESVADQLVFADRDEFRKWLEANHAMGNGVWLVFSKVERIKKLKASEALEEALCFGWIDGQIKSLDEEKYLKKFAPRRKGSRWSALNQALAMRLIESGRMTEHGLAAIERAKQAGTWDAPAPPSISDADVAVLTEALQGADVALGNFIKMAPSVRRTYTRAYLDTKSAESRARRLQWIIGRLTQNKGPM